LVYTSDLSRSDADMVFNDVWANNGDAISRAYAGTSALKGDFTRTGKRDLGGMLNDGRNSLARMYTGNFSDFFAQAVIDFMLGNRTISVFEEFLLNLTSTDPREMVKLSKIRAIATETSIARVINDGERGLGAWTMLSPSEPNVRISEKFVEKILILTAKALYVVSFDYELDKVVSTRRLPLQEIKSIQHGPYILSALHEASRDPSNNYGILLSCRSDNPDVRVTSYAMRNQPSPIVSPTAATFSQALSRGGSQIGKLSKILTTVAPTSETDIIACKALPVDVPSEADGKGFDVGGGTCQDAVKAIVKAIHNACKDVGSGKGADFVKEADIFSLAEAQRVTPLWAQVEYNFKRLLWLGS